MFDIGWSELLVIGVVALIVVGPKDLPKLFHALGQFTAKARSMAREFQNAMEQAAREAGVDEAAKDLKALTSAKSLGLDALSNVSERFDSWDEKKRGVGDGEEAAAEDGEAPEMGPATAELAAKLKAESDAAEARAAALRDVPTAEELAEVEHALPAEPAEDAPKKRRKAATKSAAKKPATKAAAPVAETTETAAKSTSARRKTPAKPKATNGKSKLVADADGAEPAEAAPAKAPRKRSTTRKPATDKLAAGKTPARKTAAGKTEA